MCLSKKSKIALILIMITASACFAQKWKGIVKGIESRTGGNNNSQAIDEQCQEKYCKTLKQSSSPEKSRLPYKGRSRAKFKRLQYSRRKLQQSCKNKTSLER